MSVNFKGHYVYIETSSPRHAGDIAWLVSSTRPATSSGCINFWYNMKGQTIDTLTVYLTIPGKCNMNIFKLLNLVVGKCIVCIGTCNNEQIGTVIKLH